MDIIDFFITDIGELLLVRISKDGCKSAPFDISARGNKTVHHEYCRLLEYQRTLFLKAGHYSQISVQ